MATLNSTTYANQIGGLVRDRISATVGCGEVRIAEIPYQLTAANVTGDILRMYRLPGGVQVLPELCGVFNQAAGSAVTIVKIGDQQDDDRYSATAITLTALAFAQVTPVAGVSNIPRYTVVTDVSDIIQVTLGGTVAATTGIFWLRLHYRMAN
jgi:hypothetical protein